MCLLRADARYKLEVDVTIGSDSHFFTGLSGDVSRGGIFVATYARVPVGRRVHVRFTLPEGDLVLEGTVRWTRAGSDAVAPGIGVRFENLAPTNLALIEKFCQERPPIYVDDDD